MAGLPAQPVLLTGNHSAPLKTQRSCSEGRKLKQNLAQNEKNSPCSKEGIVNSAVRKARSGLVHTWLPLCSPPFFHRSSCLYRTRHKPAKNHLGAPTLIVWELCRTRIPLKDPPKTQNLLCEDKTKLHRDILQSFLVGAKCEKNGNI